MPQPLTSIEATLRTVGAFTQGQKRQPTPAEWGTMMTALADLAEHLAWMSRDMEALRARVNRP